MTASSTTSPSFSTDLRIPLSPFVDQTKNPDIYNDLQLVHSAIRSLQGYIDTFLTPIITAKATETIGVGAAVSFVQYSDGSIGVRNATNNAAGKECDAFALIAGVLGSAVNCQTFGINDYFTGGVTVGARYYLGTGGQYTVTAPVAAGTLVQELGVGITPTSILFRPAKYTKQN